MITIITAKEMPLSVAKLRRLLKSKHPYIERNVDSVVSLIKHSIQNCAAFESAAISLKDASPGTVRYLLIYFQVSFCLYNVNASFQLRFIS